GEEDAGLSQQHYDNRAAQAHQRANLYHQASPANAGLVNAHGQSVTYVKKFVVDQAAENSNHENVENGADDQRTENSDGHISGRVLGFLRCRGDGIKTDIGKENDCCPAADAGPSVFATDARVGRHEGMPVDLHQLRMVQQIMAAHGHKHNQHANFDIDDHSVEIG